METDQLGGEIKDSELVVGDIGIVEESSATTSAGESDGLEQAKIEDEFKENDEIVKETSGIEGEIEDDIIGSLINPGEISPDNVTSPNKLIFWVMISISLIAIILVFVFDLWIAKK